MTRLLALVLVPSDEKGFTLPPAVHCLSFAPCRHCNPDGPDGPPPVAPPKPIPGQQSLLDLAPVESFT